MENKRENYTKSDAQKRNLSTSICVHLRPSAVKKIPPLREIEKIRKNTLSKSDVVLKALPYAHQIEKRYKTPVCRLQSALMSLVRRGGNKQWQIGYKLIFEAAPVANFLLPSFRLHRRTNLDRVFAR